MQRNRPFLLFSAIVTLIGCLLLLAPSTQALSPDKTLVLASPSEGWPPYIIPGTNTAPASGIMPDVLSEVCKRHGYILKVEYYPEKRSQLLLSEGKVDAYMKSRKWVKDPSLYLWTDPVLQSTDVLVFHKDHPIRFKTEQDLAGLNIGVIHGYFYPTLNKLFDQQRIHKHQSTNTHNLLHMLGHRHVDAAVTNRRVAEWLFRNDPNLDGTLFSFSQHTLDTAPYSFLFVKKQKWLTFIQQFNTELKTMRKDGRLQAIFNKYR